MNEEDVFEDKEKYEFLADLKKLFNKGKLMASNNFRVSVNDQICKGCSKGNLVNNFVVLNKSGKYIGSFGFLIDSEDGRLKDIYRCLLYKETKRVWIQPEGLPGLFTNRHTEPDW